MEKITSNETWFLLGNFPQISAAEITAVLSLAESSFSVALPFLILRGKTIEPKETIGILGGTIKIGQGLFTTDSEEVLCERLCSELSEQESKAVFGLSAYGRNFTGAWVEKCGKEIKKKLKNKGLRARYVFNREAALSSVSVQKNHLITHGIEFIIRKEDGVFHVARTTAVQPFEEWGARDFGRPSRDDLSGMLPPKLARIMINMSLARPNDVILDPFCGSGTILSEALSVGMNHIIGSDRSEKAVTDAKNNIDWLRKKTAKKGSVDIRIADVAALSKEFGPESIDVIVTEPYLGKPLRGHESVSVLRSQTNELATLYRLAFTEFDRILKKNGRVVVIIPRFRTNADWITMNIRENLKALGFTAETILKTGSRSYDSLLYAREGQRIGREIWRFRKK